MQNGCVRTKKIALDFVFQEDCSLRARKVLRDHLAPYHERISHARAASKLVALVCLVCRVYLLEPN